MRNHSLRRANSAISAAGFTRALFPLTMLIACRAQQNFPQHVYEIAKPQDFTPRDSKLDDQRTLTDLSTLNDEPAGAHGFVRAALGHFVDERASRLRFFGVNLSGVACLPDRDTAPRLARHFRKLGLNAVRLRGLDAPGVLLTNDGQLVPEALAQLDHFTAAQLR